MNPQERLQHLEGLLDKLLQAVEIVGASGEQLSDEFQGLIAEEISYLWNEINQLKSAPPEQPTEPTFPTNPDEEEVRYYCENEAKLKGLMKQPLLQGTIRSEIFITKEQYKYFIIDNISPNKISFINI